MTRWKRQIEYLKYHLTIFNQKWCCADIFAYFHTSSTMIIHSICALVRFYVVLVQWSIPISFIVIYIYIYICNPYHSKLFHSYSGNCTTPPFLLKYWYISSISLGILYWDPILWLPWCQWSSNVWYGWVDNMTPATFLLIRLGTSVTGMVAWMIEAEWRINASNN